MAHVLSIDNSLGECVDRLTGLDQEEAAEMAACLREDGLICVTSILTVDWTYEVGVYEARG